MHFQLMLIDKEENVHKLLQIHYQNQLRNCNKKHVSIVLGLLMFSFPNTSV